MSEMFAYDYLGTSLQNKQNNRARVLRFLVLLYHFIDFTNFSTLKGKHKTPPFGAETIT